MRRFSKCLVDRADRREFVQRRTLNTQDVDLERSILNVAQHWQESLVIKRPRGRYQAAIERGDWQSQAYEIEKK